MYAIINSFVTDNINPKNKENTIFEIYMGTSLKNNVFSISLNKELFVNKLKKNDLSNSSFYSEKLFYKNNVL